jgi:hypothetical protein
LLSNIERCGPKVATQVSGPRGLLQILRGERLGLFEEIEADHLHAKTPELDISVGEGRNFSDLGVPSGESFVTLARSETDRDRPTDALGQQFPTPPAMAGIVFDGDEGRGGLLTGKRAVPTIRMLRSR